MDFLPLYIYTINHRPLLQNTGLCFYFSVAFSTCTHSKVPVPAYPFDYPKSLQRRFSIKSSKMQWKIFFCDCLFEINHISWQEKQNTLRNLPPLNKARDDWLCNVSKDRSLARNQSSGWHTGQIPPVDSYLYHSSPTACGKMPKDHLPAFYTLEQWRYASFWTARYIDNNHVATFVTVFRRMVMSDDLFCGIRKGRFYFIPCGQVLP